MLNAYDDHTVELPKLFLQSVRSGLPTEYLNSICERNLSIVQTRKTKLNLSSLPNETCTVGCNSLRYRGAKLIHCPIETGFCSVYFPKKIQRET